VTNCVVELYGIDFIASYQHAFVYIRQIAIHLKECYENKKNKKTVESVYNWQTFHSIRVWVKLLCANPNQQDLWLLGLPIVQLIHGIMSLVPTPRYYPLRIHYLHLLNEMAQSRVKSTKPFFLNSLSYILEMLTYPFFHKNIKPWSGKPQYFTYTLKAPEKILQTYAFYEAVMREVLELIVTYFDCYKKSVTFPELALPALVQLKQFLQTCQPSPFPSKIKQYVEILDEHSKVILSHRNLANFNPSDEHKVSSFMANVKQKTPLEIYYNKFKLELEQQKKLMSESETDQPAEEEEQPKSKSKKDKFVPEPEPEDEEDDYGQDEELKNFDMDEFT